MTKIFAVAVGFLTLAPLITPAAPLITPAAAADQAVIRHSQVALACPRVWTCVGDQCGWRHSCELAPCPDGYGCYPLYGAYGPWGGLAYGSSFSFKY
jgi:hypothetical protein